MMILLQTSVLQHGDSESRGDCVVRYAFLMMRAHLAVYRWLLRTIRANERAYAGIQMQVQQLAKKQGAEMKMNPKFVTLRRLILRKPGVDRLITQHGHNATARLLSFVCKRICMNTR